MRFIHYVPHADENVTGVVRLYIFCVRVFFYGVFDSDITRFSGDGGSGMFAASIYKLSYPNIWCKIDAGKNTHTLDPHQIPG